MTHSSLQGALEALYGQERRKDKLGLDGTRSLLAALGSPERRFRSVHVAGTNGKGTTCALIERVLRVAGVRTGLFTSPHLVDFRERIRVDGRWADEAWLHEALARIEALPEGRERTFFEVATALGFAYFAAHGVEWAVVEVGLGGRLDTTNVLEPAVSVITSIGLDHTEILGADLASIAFEKAGIVKPGVPVVVAAERGEDRDVFDRVAAERGAALVPALEATAIRRGAQGGYRARTAAWGAIEVTPSLAGDPTPNVACALAALDALARAGVAIPRAAVERGIAEARWPGRLERSGTEARLWWDGAHNAHGAGRLAHSWRAAARPEAAALVLAVSRDKDLAGMLAALRAIVPGGALWATRARNERALPPEEMAARAAAAGWRAATAPDVVTACRAALAATAPQGAVLLAGSLFAVGEAMEHFGGAPGEML